MLAIIPARGGSKRIPRKNIHPFLGKPMLAWPVEKALASGVFSRVIVSTDDEEIAGVARQYGAEVVMRPAHLATDEASELGACDHVLGEVNSPPEFFCIIYPTAVLLLPDDFRKSFDLTADADVVMGVSAYPIHPYKSLKQNADGYWEMMFPVECKMRSQFYPHVTASNGTLYWMRTSHFLAAHNYYPKRLKVYELPPERAVDIDVPQDLEWAERIAR